mmetsp:Transcript_17937/g.45616  ORF Transcript_17937/g.45616 Transcript_17937/m.45616 type:complete len:251 (+) Transcript_17937:1337-2089(+)
MFSSTKWSTMSTMLYVFVSARTFLCPSSDFVPRRAGAPLPVAWSTEPPRLFLSSCVVRRNSRKSHSSSVAWRFVGGGVENATGMPVSLRLPVGVFFAKRSGVLAVLLIRPAWCSAITELGKASIMPFPPDRFLSTCSLSFLYVSTVPSSLAASVAKERTVVLSVTMRPKNCESKPMAVGKELMLLLRLSIMLLMLHSVYAHSARTLFVYTTIRDTRCASTWETMPPLSSSSDFSMWSSGSIGSDRRGIHG